MRIIQGILACVGRLMISTIFLLSALGNKITNVFVESFVRTRLAASDTEICFRFDSRKSGEATSELA